MHQTVTSKYMQIARGTAYALDTPKTMLLKLLRFVLHMFLYNQRAQILLLGDPHLRIDFANEFLMRYNVNDDWHFRILWTEESHFNLNGNMNTKNCMQYVDMKPHTVAPVPVFDAKVTV